MDDDYTSKIISDDSRNMKLTNNEGILKYCCARTRTSTFISMTSKVREKPALYDVNAKRFKQAQLGIPF
jgi:hypothetical protein